MPLKFRVYSTEKIVIILFVFCFFHEPGLINGLVKDLIVRFVQIGLYCRLEDLVVLVDDSELFCL